MRRYIHNVCLRGGRGALPGNGLAMTVVNSKTGEPLYHTSVVTHPHVSADNMAQVALAGRGRWKVENEHNTVLKTKGPHIEHHVGHGTQYLWAFLLSLNLLALLAHTALGWCDDRYAWLRQTLVRRQTFFDDIRALTRYRVFESWHHVWDFMISGLELRREFDTS